MRFKVLLFLLLFSITNFLFFYSISSTYLANNTNQKRYNTQISDTVNLNYEENKTVSDYCTYNIIWAFSVSDIYQGIKVLALEEDQYKNYQNGYNYLSYRLSDRKNNNDSGELIIPHADNWYIVFINQNIEEKSINLTYYVEFDKIDDYKENNDYYSTSTILYIFLGIIIFFGILILVSLNSSQFHKDRDLN